MSKKTKIIMWISIIVVLILSLAIFNIINSKGLDDYHKEKVLTISLNDKNIDKINYKDIQDIQSEEFEIYYKRKVGNPELKKYRGVQIKEIFKELDISITEMAEVEITAVDNFVVTILADEIMTDENVYVVFKEDGVDLADDFGTYMIVIRGDDMASRWNKRIVNINIKDKK